FKHRPKYMKHSIYIDARKSVYEKLNLLIEAANEMKSSEKVNSKDFRQLKNEVETLENELKDIEMCHDNWKNYNPLVSYVKLVLSFLCLVTSILWFGHIIFNNLTNISPFLNVIIIGAIREINFGLIGVVIFVL